MSKKWLCICISVLVRPAGGARHNAAKVPRHARQRQAQLGQRKAAVQARTRVAAEGQHVRAHVFSAACQHGRALPRAGAVAVGQTSSVAPSAGCPILIAALLVDVARMDALRELHMFT
jgi:hypothetical protein